MAIFNPVWPVQEWRSMSDTSAPAAEDDKAAKAPVKGDPVDDLPEDDEEEKRLAAEYAAEQEKAAAGEGAPRRRLRR